jgi:hypothetical protein
LEKISLSIPCLILSTETNISAEIEKHVLTPFGYIDIIFPNTLGEDKEGTPFEVKVIGDIDSWMLDESMPLEFKATLRRFLVEMVEICTGSSLPKSTRNSIHLSGEDQKVKIILTGHPDLKGYNRQQLNP